MHRKRVNVITLGCSKNTVDSEKLLRQLQAGGYEVFHDAGETEADTVIINTCGFINDAREESIDMILRFAKAKRNGLVKNLIVTGCLSEIYREALKSEIPEADAWFGVESLAGVLKHAGCHPRKNLIPERVITGPGHYAYLKISEGCDRKCTFCSIPLIRGKHLSVKMEDLLAESLSLEKQGVKELILVAQDLNYYGVDLYGKRMLANLLNKISASTGFEWIRLQYLYPSGLSDSLLKTIRDSRNICKYIDIPLQHISDRMLKKMKRGYSELTARKLLEHIKQLVPGAAIRTTFITGFPGESDRDHRDLVEFIRETEFDRLGVFRYSHEEKTFAGISYSDNVPEKVKELRAAEIMEIQQGIAMKKNLQRRGQIMRVLIDAREGEYFTGRTEADSPEVDQEVLVNVKYKLAPGNFYNIKITGSTEFDLIGEPLPEKERLARNID
ncbi:MAG TPA: 30S ribosomal protein S12 methylthiotransferase RimO [Bacteroidales bacterium]|nr:30S ribosomal protein S12 methylthiotransferase RimO [Bacteroidales bacterium]HRR92897.1 30S ribosomal protein S12 methylthiotransferase RimO [Bacteroidales bacterium]HRT89986.1 30S ribosomal protein S12 methylthiotransferase RimO [Bacteroidales bacterium]